MGRLLLWLLPATLLACAVALRSDLDESGAPRSPEPPRPTVNHRLHIDRELACADCHDPKGTGEPALPESATCFDCHEKDLAKEPDRVRVYFEAVQQPDGSYRFSRPAYMADIRVAHKEHAKSRVECVSCHGPPLERAFPRPAPLALMNTCTECHDRKEGAETTCETCHEEARKEVPPASHAAPGFRTKHGETAPEGWREGKGETCAICHEVPQSCTACHKETMPQSHREAGFDRLHGRGELLGRERPFAELSCSLCHQERSCSACHQSKKPHSHTPSFERRYHGFHADLDRQTCATCHKPDFCQSCHESTEPVSHRGNWDEAHCLYCHEPLPSNGCYACHKDTLSHLTAPPKPLNATHAGAADPTDCLGCHVVLPHFDSGGRCGTCHR
jgi:hypothetical protein